MKINNMLKKFIIVIALIYGLPELTFAIDATYPVWVQIDGTSALTRKMQIQSDHDRGENGTYDKGPIPTSIPDAVQKFKDLMASLQVDSGTKTWEKVSANGRMELPAFVIQFDFWLPGQNMPIYFPEESLETNVKYSNYRWSWIYFMRGLPNQAFAIMAVDAARTQIKTNDLLRLSAALGYQVPSGNDWIPMVDSPAKTDWQTLYNSPNPCYRLIAFEFYDKAGLTLQELLAVYEAGLFHSCSYVEMRILAGIKKNQDYRPEVKQLVQQYLAGNPLLNDGTQINTHKNDPDAPFEDVKKGAQAIIDAINAQ